MGRFCKLPWLSVTVSAEGNYYPCCTIRNFEKVNNWEDYQNSDQLRIIKDDFLEGREPIECSDCWVHEAAGIESLRQMAEGASKDIEVDFDNVTDPVQIELAITQVCNLACRICGPDSSSRWVKDNNKLFNIGMADEYTAKAKRHLRDPAYVNWVLSHQSNLEYLQFIGGEPFADQLKEQTDLLNKLDHPESIQLSYITNGTVLPSAEMIEAWRKFKKVIISVSVDGVHKVFEYGRYPAKFDVVEKNLYYYMTLAHAAENVVFKINNTVSAINIFNVPEFDEWYGGGCEFFDITYSLLSGPACYNIKNLNPEVKAYLSCKLEGFPAILTALNKEPDTLYYYNSFVRTTKALDKIRKQTFLDIYPPEYTRLFKF